MTKTNIKSKKELWERIKNHNFNNLVPNSTVAELIKRLGGKRATVWAFATKIMVKHRLPRAFIFTAIEEYKKFVYLGVISDFIVTPSKYIDQVWHEHVLFSKAYREFCNDVLHYQFDHQPELIGTEEQIELYNEQYLKTLELYRKEFGMEPPENIWGTPKFDKDRIEAKKPKRKETNEDQYTSGGDYLYYYPLHTHYDQENLKEEFTGFDSGNAEGSGASGDWVDSSDGGVSCSSCSGGCGGGGD